MNDRVLSPRVLLLIAMALPIAGCTNPLAVSVSVSPTSQSIGAGQTVQFTALGTYGHGSNHPSSQQDITDSVTWTSSAPGVATISATGVATGVSAGTTTITASINGFTGVVSSSAALTVTGNSGGGGGTPSSLAIIPNTQLVTTVGYTAQFQAIETTATGATVDVTNLAYLGFKQPIDCHHRRLHWACHGSKSGHSHDHCDLSQRRKHADGHCDLYSGKRVPGRRRIDRRIYRCHHRPQLAVCLCLRPDGPIHCSCYIGSERS